MHCFEDRRRHFLTYSPAILITHVTRLALDLLQVADRVQRLFGQLTFVSYVQIEKLATCMSHAAGFSDALLKTSFVTSEIIANQLAVPVAQEIACMFTGTAWAEVVHHDFERRKRCRAVGPGPSVGPVGSQKR